MRRTMLDERLSGSLSAIGEKTTEYIIIPIHVGALPLPEE
jgi:hypothetical protein